MITKHQQKYIQSLHNKKYRTEYGEFLVEGEKGLLELLASDFEIVELFCTADFLEKNKIKEAVTVTSQVQIEQISTFKSNNSGIAVVKQKANLTPKNLEGLTLFLDNINDPGNLGTIIRLADWYGLENIICSENTVELYNPKVISSTMGSYLNIHCFYTNLSDFLKNWKSPLYAADLVGANVHKQVFEEKSGIIIGSESHGISESLKPFISQNVTIPKIGKAESLNAAMATAIILDNIFRDV